MSAARPLAPVLRRLPARLPAQPLPSVPRGPALGMILALHAALVWGLLHLSPWRLPAAEPVPLMVTLEAAPATTDKPPPSLSRIPAPLPSLPWGVPPPVQLQEDTPPAPSPAPLPAPLVNPSAAVTPGPPALSATGAAEAHPPAPIPAQIPAQIPPAAIQYRVMPEVVYPPASRRLGETGLVIVAVWVDEDGEPRELQIAQSSGHERLDRAALAGVRRARFQPWRVDGRPRAGWARIPIPFELER